MASRWFYGHDENRTGPYTDRQLRDLADAGHILPTDTIWKEGIAQGVAANDVKNLFAPGPGAAAAVSAELPAPAAPPPAPDILAEPQSDATPTGTDTVTTPEASLPEPATPPQEPGIGVIVADSEPQPQEDAPVPASPRLPKARQARAVAGKGAIIVGQDGVFVKLKKKCLVCGHEDSSRTTLPIRSGLNKTTFFCRKCRRVRQVEFQGLLN